MDRKRVESTTTYAAVVLLSILGPLSVLAVADGAFGWDLLDENWESVAWFVIGATAVTIVCCAVVSAMLNVSLMAESMAKIAEKLDRDS
ncbi:MAG: hypothetical protein AAGA68_27320 [Pseudomonadota bacterium]